MILRIFTGTDVWHDETLDAYKISDGCLMLFARVRKPSRYDDGLELTKAYSATGWLRLEVVTGAGQPATGTAYATAVSA